MGIIIKKPIGASKVYDELNVATTFLLSNLKNQEQEGIKEEGSTNKYFTGLTGSLPGELGQVFDPEDSGAKSPSGYNNASTSQENYDAVQKPLGASNFTSSIFLKDEFPLSYNKKEELGSTLKYALNGTHQYALSPSLSYDPPKDSEIQKPLGMTDLYNSGSSGVSYSNVNGNAIPSSYEVLDDLTPNVVSPNGNPQYGLDANKAYAAPDDTNVQIPLALNTVSSTDVELVNLPSSQVPSSTPNPRPTNWQYQITPSTLSTNTNYATYTREQLKEAETNQRVGSDIANQKGIIDFRKNLRGNSFFSNVTKQDLFPEPGINYDFGSLKRLETRVNIGDPGNPYDKDLTKYSVNYASEFSYDKINASVIYQSEAADYKTNNDLVKFTIGAMDGKTPNLQVFMHFRAFLGSISDNYTGNWDSVNYVGRGENFYNYTGFDRKVSLSFTVAAQTKGELEPMYKKLNFLASNLAPDYSEFGYMRGPLITLTVGGYFYNQPGFITGLTYEMSEETPWEIGIDEEGEYDGSVKELTHIIKVSSFNFTPIHTFPVRKQVNNYGGVGGKAIGYGKERYIALRAGSNDLYGTPYNSPIPDANNNTPDPAPIKTTPKVENVPQDKSTMILAAPTYGTTPASNAQGGAGLTGNAGQGAPDIMNANNTYSSGNTNRNAFVRRP